MQSLQPPRRRLRARRQRNGAHQTVAPPPPPVPNVDVLGPQCRICWQEADEDDGGRLLAPCRCTGSSRHVHERCLAEWMGMVAQRKGVHAAQHCDICRGRYRLPSEMRLREPPVELLRRQAAALLGTRVGTVVWYYARVGYTFASACAIVGAFHGLWRVPRVVLSAQRDPLGTLLPLRSDLLASLTFEAMFNRTLYEPVMNFLQYGLGLGVYCAASWAQTHAAQLPTPLFALVWASACACKVVSGAVQYFFMTFIMLYAGMGNGFTAGWNRMLSWPVHLAAALGEAGGRLARSGAALLAAVLRHVHLWRRRPRRRPPPPGGWQGFAARGRAALLVAGADLHTSVSAFLT